MVADRAELVVELEVDQEHAELADDQGDNLEPRAIAAAVELADFDQGDNLELRADRAPRTR